MLYECGNGRRVYIDSSEYFILTDEELDILTKEKCGCSSIRDPLYRDSREKIDDSLIDEDTIEGDKEFFNSRPKGFTIKYYTEDDFILGGDITPEQIEGEEEDLED